jgi:hypothetical protein
VARKRRLRSKGAEDASEGSGEVSDLRVLARVLALQTAWSIPADERVVFLVGAGFGQAEAAAMLHMNPISVRTALHRHRNRRGARGDEE